MKALLSPADELGRDLDVIVNDEKLRTREDTLGHTQLALGPNPLPGYNQQIEKTALCIPNLANFFQSVVDRIPKPRLVLLRPMDMG